jgi:hypothetical protein
MPRRPGKNGPQRRSKEWEETRHIPDSNDLLLPFKQVGLPMSVPYRERLVFRKRQEFDPLEMERRERGMAHSKDAIRSMRKDEENRKAVEEYLASGGKMTKNPPCEVNLGEDALSEVLRSKLRSAIPGGGLSFGAVNKANHLWRW